MKRKADLPRVSQILDLLCPLESGRLSEEELSILAEHGTYVHRLCHRLANRQLTGKDFPLINWDAVPESPMKRKGLAFEQFLRDTGAHVIWSERSLSDGTYRGTPDLLVEMPKREHLVIDIKPPHPQFRYRVQIAAYRKLILFNVPGPVTLSAAILCLKDGGYKVHYVPTLECDEHYKAFAAQVAIWHWRKRHVRKSKSF